MVEQIETFSKERSRTPSMSRTFFVMRGSRETVTGRWKVSRPPRPPRVARI